MEWRVVLKAKDGEGIAWRDYSMTILRDKFGEYFSRTPTSRKKLTLTPKPSTVSYFGGPGRDSAPHSRQSTK